MAKNKQRTNRPVEILWKGDVGNGDLRSRPLQCSDAAMVATIAVTPFPLQMRSTYCWIRLPKANRRLGPVRVSPKSMLERAKILVEGDDVAKLAAAYLARTALETTVQDLWRFHCRSPVDRRGLGKMLRDLRAVKIVLQTAMYSTLYKRASEFVHNGAHEQRRHVRELVEAIRIVCKHVEKNKRLPIVESGELTAQLFARIKELEDQLQELQKTGESRRDRCDTVNGDGD